MQLSANDIYYTITPNGVVKNVTPPLEERTFDPETGKFEVTLSFLQNSVGGGLVERIVLPSGNVLWANEEGMMREDCHYNEQATSLLWDSHPRMFGQNLFGTILVEFTGGDDFVGVQGETFEAACDSWIMQYDTTTDVLRPFFEGEEE